MHLLASRAVKVTEVTSRPGFQQWQTTAASFCHLQLGWEKVTARSMSAWDLQSLRSTWRLAAAGDVPVIVLRPSGDTALEEGLHIIDLRPTALDNPFLQLTGLLQEESGSPLCCPPFHLVPVLGISLASPLFCLLETFSQHPA